MTYYTENLLRKNKRYKKFIEDFQLGMNFFQENGPNGFTSSMKELVNPNDLKNLNKSTWEKKEGLPNRKNSFPYKENCLKKLNAKSKKSPVLVDFESPIMQNNRFSIGKEKKYLLTLEVAVEKHLNYI